MTYLSAGDLAIAAAVLVHAAVVWMAIRHFREKMPGTEPKPEWFYDTSVAYRRPGDDL